MIGLTSNEINKTMHRIALLNFCLLNLKENIKSTLFTEKK